MIVLTVLSLTLCYNAYTQTIEDQITKELWGEINEGMPEHRGKAGLMLLDFYPDYTFKAFQNTCTNDNVLQTGNWHIKDDVISFEIITTKRTIKDSNRKGILLTDKDVGKIKYKLISLDHNGLVLEHSNMPSKLLFEVSKFNYMPE